MMIKQLSLNIRMLLSSDINWTKENNWLRLKNPTKKNTHKKPPQYIDVDMYSDIYEPIRSNLAWW